jgi:hypothetical protein
MSRPPREEVGSSRGGDQEERRSGDAKPLGQGSAEHGEREARGDDEDDLAEV